MISSCLEGKSIFSVFGIIFSSIFKINNTFPMKNTVFILFLFISSFILAQEKPIDVPKILVKVSMGESVQFKKVKVKLVGVLEDSRCPSDVTCVWEGQAKVLVEVTQAGQETQQVELLFGRTINGSIYVSKGYSIKGMSLTPYPTSAGIKKMNYILLVSEEGN